MSTASQDLDPETCKRLGDQLIRLGDMMGDGLHLEPDGKWISREYRQVAKALGYIKKEDRSARITEINRLMDKRTAQVKCRKCDGKLKQTRSGAKRAKCHKCESLWQLLK
ncbi:hypothetical protein DN730_08025 [Marinomonas piezotolerans]|uniref:Uncharacterized protein n=1 Tax=Marinomonas piezotolerans TaxID=2213058 RepID=A0A370U994_9GAMM|nr:hypothetical protein [Marinomonas piezotolerans]RDL44342.1 hypothetical protein DN730_08025 [Marinomonas piezotolerans]